MTEKQQSHSNYKGFVAGVFSGIAKLSVGHPFDTIKVRLQTSDSTRFSGPLQCLLQTIRKEGIPGLYKGATPPLVGWMFMDSIMLGSLTFYRRILHETLFNPHRMAASPSAFAQRDLPLPDAKLHKLPTIGHAMAGVMAGATVSFIAAPVEHIKARLQIQYSSKKSERMYKGPIDCVSKIYKYHGIPWSLPWSFCYVIVQKLLLLLVGVLRYIYKAAEREDRLKHTGSELLGGRLECPGVLDDELSE